MKTTKQTLIPFRCDGWSWEDTTVGPRACRVPAGRLPGRLRRDANALAGPGEDRDRATGDTFLLDEPRPASSHISEGAEPVIQTHPTDPHILWIGDTEGIYKSKNGGDDWRELPNPFPESADGIHIDKHEGTPLYATTMNTATVQFALSHDGGENWQAGPGTSAPTARPIDSGGVVDRPWVATDGEDHLAVVWNPGSSLLDCRTVSA
jgi:hypothetical protein